MLTSPSLLAQFVAAGEFPDSESRDKRFLEIADILYQQASNKMSLSSIDIDGRELIVAISLTLPSEETEQKVIDALATPPSRSFEIDSFAVSALILHYMKYPAPDGMVIDTSHRRIDTNGDFVTD